MTDTESHRDGSSRSVEPQAPGTTFERRLELSRLHRRATQAALETETEEELLSAVLHEVCTRTDWPAGHAFLRGSDGFFEPTESWHLDRPQQFGRLREVTESFSFGPGEGTIGRVAATTRPEWIPDVDEDDRFLRADGAAGEVRSVVSVPLIWKGEVIGVLELLSDRRREEESDLLETLLDIGAQVAVGLDRIRTIRALEISEAKFSGIVSISAEAMISIDADQRIVLFNQGAREIFGYRPDEVMGRHVEVLIPQRFHAVHRDHVHDFGASQFRARRMGERREVYGVRKSGEEFPAQASISKLDVDGEVLYSVVLRDVTDQRSYEEALRTHAVELERSNRELEQFAFVASHDLQEPLRKIQAFGDRLMARYGEELDERGRDYLERMHGASRRMSLLIQDLLAFSRVTTRARPFEPVDLEDLVREVLTDLEHRLRETSGRIDVDQLPTIQADPSQMRQLFQNLVGNALKYHRDGIPPQVTIRARLVESPTSEEQMEDESRDGSGAAPSPVDSRTLEIEIQDNGIGFDDEYAERIFGIFHRLHGRGEYEGTGIGLAICRKIVERHDGTLTAQGSPGEGATFTIRMPIRAQHSSDDKE